MQTWSAFLTRQDRKASFKTLSAYGSVLIFNHEHFGLTGGGGFNLQRSADPFADAPAQGLQSFEAAAVQEHGRASFDDQAKRRHGETLRRRGTGHGKAAVHLIGPQL